MIGRWISKHVGSFRAQRGEEEEEAKTIAYSILEDARLKYEAAEKLLTDAAANKEANIAKVMDQAQQKADAMLAEIAAKLKQAEEKLQDAQRINRVAGVYLKEIKSGGGYRPICKHWERKIISIERSTIDIRLNQHCWMDLSGEFRTDYTYEKSRAYIEIVDKIMSKYSDWKLESKEIKVPESSGNIVFSKCVEWF